MTDRQLQRLLEAAAASTVYPETPELRGTVLARIGTARPASRRLRPVAAPLFIALVLLLVLAGALLIPPSREAIARFFGVQGSTIERGVPLTPFPPAAYLDKQATPVSISDWRGINRPDVGDPLLQTYAANYAGQNVTILHYARFDLWQTPLPITATFGKVAPPGSEVRDVMVGSRDGRWLTGEHYVYYSLSGRIAEASQRTVTRNTLVWRTPAAFYRIETSLGLNEALAIARTLP